MKFEQQMNSLAAQQLEAFKIEVRLEFESLASFIWFWAQIENSIAERTQNTRICSISRPKTMLDANKLRVTREVAPHISLKLWLVKNSSQVPNQSHRPFFRHMHHRLPPKKNYNGWWHFLHLAGIYLLQMCVPVGLQHISQGERVWKDHEHIANASMPKVDGS